MELSFKYLEKDEFDLLSPRLFALLYENMDPIAPATESYEDCFAEWSRAYGGAFKGRETRQILAAFSPDGDLAAFIGYCHVADTFYMEEIQIGQKFRAKYGIFRTLYSMAIDSVPMTLKFTDAYAHKNNEKSLAILSRQGLKIVGENSTGNCYHLRGEFSDILAWKNKT